MSSPTPAASSSAQPRADGSAESRRHLVVIPLAGLVAVLPLIAHGCSCGHDFDFHLLNWMEAARQFSRGTLHPHWAFSPAFNAGEPRFVFYPPLSWYLGALLGLLLTHLPGVSTAAGWNATPIVFTWIALTLSGLTLHRLASEFLNANAALLAATIYLANPYMLFTAYERTAYAELLAAAWIPLLFHAILRERVTIPRIAPPIALLWLTNAPAAVMGTYALALLAAIRLATASRKTQVSEARPGAPAPDSALKVGAPHLVSEMWESRHSTTLHLVLNTIAGTALGLALAAFYIVPAAYERRFVQISMATIAGMSFDQNFLFEHTGTTSDELLHNAVLRTASLIALILLIATAAALFAVHRANKSGAPGLASESWESRPKIASPTIPFAIVTAAIAFLLTPLSAPIWRHAPDMAFVQFPWRLLAILAPIFALSIAAIFTKSPAIPSFKASPPADKSPGAPSFAPLRRVGRNPFAIPFAKTLLAVALTLPAYHFFHQPCDPEDTAPARLALFHSNAGTDPTDEYTPTTADNDALQPNNPPYWLAPAPEDGPVAVAPVFQIAKDARPTVKPGPAPTHLALTASESRFLILNLRDYPAWSIAVNGAPIPTRHPRPDGLIAIPIPAGLSTIEIRYARMTDQTIGDAITLLALPLFLFTLRSKRRAHS